MRVIVLQRSARGWYYATELPDGAVPGAGETQTRMLKPHTPRFSLLLVTILLISSQAGANSFGPFAGNTGSIASAGNSCAQALCHTGATGSGGVEILGAPGSYEVNAIYDLRVRIHDAAQLAAGFQLSVEDASGAHVGTLIVTDAVNTALNFVSPSWIQHTLTGVNNSAINWAASGHAVEYAFQWRAPSTDAGGLTFWAAGNAVNRDFFNTFDHVYLTSTTSFALLDSDLDGIDDDGNGSGKIGDQTCVGGGTSTCDDNCRWTANPDQADAGGVESPTNPMGNTPDGIGDLCQCGDVDGNGRVQLEDGDAIRDRLVQLPIGTFFEELCNVGPPGAPESCDIVDWVLLTRTFSALDPGISNVCPPALPPAD